MLFYVHNTTLDKVKLARQSFVRRCRGNSILAADSRARAAFLHPAVYNVILRLEVVYDATDNKAQFSREPPRVSFRVAAINFYISGVH